MPRSGDDWATVEEVRDVRRTRSGTHRDHPSGPLPVLPPLPRRRWSWRPVVPVLAVVPLLPVAVMARPVYLSVPRLQDYAGVVLGLGATLCLLGCLAITPVSWLTRFPAAAAWRRWLGLCVFFTGAAGLTIALLGAKTGTQAGMQAAGNVREWTGTLAVVVLLPLAAISNKLSQKTLGGHWKTWQRRLTWAAWAVIAAHILILAAWQVEVAFITASAPLVAARIPAARKDISAWRRSGYADPARWVLAGLLAGAFAYGFTVLAWTEVMCSVQVSRLT